MPVEGVGRGRATASGGYFGSAPGCYGVLHWPNSPSAAGVVIVNDFGTRALSAYWTFRRLAERLSDVGHPVLRFDFPGTGDSPTMTGNRVDGWLSSVEDAIAQHVASASSQVHLVGFGIGALLALNAALRSQSVRRVQLIQPFLSGARYLLAVDPAPSPVEGGRFVCCHVISQKEEQSLRTLAADFAPRAPALEVELFAFDGDDSAELQKALIESGHRCLTFNAQDQAQWLQDSTYNRVPEFFDEIIERLRGAPVAEDSVRRTRLSQRHSAVALGYQEEAVDCAGLDGQALHGVLATPLKTSLPKALVLFLGTAANRRAGMSDNNTYWARALAQAGIATLRFDASGFGDSSPRDGFKDNEVLVDRNYTDADPWVSAMRQRGFTKFGAMGLSSGGFNAFKLCQRDPGVIGLFGVNVARFVEVSFARAVREDLPASAFYWAALRNPETWRKLFRGKVNVRQIAPVLFKRLVGRGRTALKLALARLRGAEGVQLGQAHQDMLAFLARPAAAAHLVYSEGDKWVETFEKDFGPHGAALTGQPNFQLSFLPGADHAISDPTAAKQVAELARVFFTRVLADREA